MDALVSRDLFFFFSVEQKLKIITEIADALNYVHKNKFIHRFTINFLIIYYVFM